MSTPAESTMTTQALGPAKQGVPGTQPTPAAMGISANARAELQKFTPEIRSRVLDVVARKG
jgi:hypothetical protein